MKNHRSTALLRTLGLTAKFIGLYIQDQFLAEGIDLTRPQFVLLRVLSDEDGRSQNELAFITERDKTSMTRLVSSMESKGLVVRRSDKQDLRRKTIFITEEGKLILNKAWPIMEEIEKTISNDLDPKDIKTTLLTINKIQAKVLSTTGVKL